MVKEAEDIVGVHFLHIGKTGGTTIKKMIRSNRLRKTSSGVRLSTHHHPTTLPEVLGWNEANTAAFFLRDPVRRFVSGFNSRLREGAPAKSIPWKPAERLAFGHFPTPNDLAEALSSDNPSVLDHAYSAMNAMVHARMHFTYWLHDVEYLASRLDRIEFLGFQETYADDVTRFFQKLGVDDVEMEHMHQAPATSSTQLSELAEENLKRWYADDIVIYNWALEHRDRWA